MKPVEKLKEEIERKDRSRFLSFLVFLIISTVLWFLIKLSKDYTTQSVFTLVYIDAPVNKWVSTPEQEVKFSFVADGFVTLAHRLVPRQKRVVELSLEEVPYRLEGGYTYSYSSQYVAERVADRLNIPAGNVTINDERQYFNMEDLQSKVLPVSVPLKIQTQRQYQLYGAPGVTPDKVTVYGPKNLLDTLKSVSSMPLEAYGASEDLQRTLALDLLGGTIRSDVGQVEVTVDIEQFTEVDIDVPVAVTDSLELRFFPETVTLKCMVPIRDYATVNGSSFKVLADTSQLHRLQPLLDVRLEKVPANVQVIRMEPGQVEYLILEDRSKK